MIITKLKNSLFYKELINNYFILGFSVVLLVFSINYPIGFLLLFLLLYYLNKKNKLILKINLFLMTIVLLIFIVNSLLIRDKQYTKFYGVVTHINEKEYYNELTVRNGLEKVLIYDYSLAKIELGDRINAEGENKKLESNNNRYEFNYKEYLLSKKIVSIIKVNNVKIDNNKVNGFNIIYIIRKYMYKYIDGFDILSQRYIKGLVFGDTSKFSDNVNESIRINGISHLFAISGLHIQLLISILEFIIGKTKIRDKNKNKYICAFLFMYLIITYFAISVMRAIFMYYLKIINKKYKLKLSSLDIISILFILFILVNPLIIYNMSFKLSFLASFIIILLSQTIGELNIKLNSLSSLLVMTIIVQIGTLPIVINMNNSYNLFSIIANILFVNLITYIILPLSFIVIIVPFVSNIYKYILITFENINEYISTNLSINIDIPSFEGIDIILFYGLIILILTLRNRKLILLFCIFIIGFYFKTSLNIIGNVSFLSLYEGDATIIDLPLNKGIIVIDTGTGYGNTLSNHLKAKGIRKIDYLVLTHNHLDHNGEAGIILNEFNVSNLIVNAYDNSVFSKTTKTIKMKKGDSFSCNGYVFTCLNPSKNNYNENDNGLVLQTNIGGLEYLFLADVSKEIENKLDVIKIDVVKVGHHGSNTSTSEKFYQRINPTYVIITPGVNNKYGFPHKEVMKIFEKYKIYRTDIDKQIDINFFYKKSIISTLR